jgi:hypothetical protein
MTGPLAEDTAADILTAVVDSPEPEPPSEDAPRPGTFRCGDDACRRDLQLCLHEVPPAQEPEIAPTSTCVDLPDTCADAVRCDCLAGSDLAQPSDTCEGDNLAGLTVTRAVSPTSTP